MAAAPEGLGTAGAAVEGLPGIATFGKGINGLPEAAAPATVPVITPYSTIPCARIEEAVPKVARTNRVTEYLRILRVIANSWKARWGTTGMIVLLIVDGNQILFNQPALRMRRHGFKVVD
jgi:hypothetical protein